MKRITMRITDPKIMCPLFEFYFTAGYGSPYYTVQVSLCIRNATAAANRPDAAVSDPTPAQWERAACNSDRARRREEGECDVSDDSLSAAA